MEGVAGTDQGVSHLNVSLCTPLKRVDGTAIDAAAGNSRWLVKFSFFQNNSGRSITLIRNRFPNAIGRITNSVFWGNRVSEGVLRTIGGRSIEITQSQFFWNYGGDLRLDDGESQTPHRIYKCVFTGKETDFGLVDVIEAQFEALTETLDPGPRYTSSACLVIRHNSNVFCETLQFIETAVFRNGVESDSVSDSRGLNRSNGFSLVPASNEYRTKPGFSKYLSQSGFTISFAFSGSAVREDAKDSDSGNLWLVAGAVSGVGVFLILLVILVACMHRKQSLSYTKSRPQVPNTSPESDEESSRSGTRSDVSSSPEI
jgi:hypothetical protein